ASMYSQSDRRHECRRKRPQDLVATRARIEPRAHQRSDGAVGTADVECGHDGAFTGRPDAEYDVAAQLHYSEGGNDDGGILQVVCRERAEYHPNKLLYHVDRVVLAEHCIFLSSRHRNLFPLLRTRQPMTVGKALICSTLYLG